MKKRFLIVLLAVLSAVFVQASVWADGENAAAYLREYYDVTFEGKVSAGDFNDALKALGAEPVDAETLTLADAVVGAVRLANMEEMALSYADKAGKILAHEEVKADESHAPYIACALELDLVDDDDDFDGPVSAKAAAKLLYRAAEIAGKGRHYVGRLDDDDILTVLLTTMSSAEIFDDEVLNDAGITIIINDATTGYSLKYSGNDARFLEENTIRYGHDDITHLLQLAALLKAENCDAYVQIEPKVSVYEYMLEWGEPAEPTPTYAVHEMEEGRYFAFALEYDMVLEFESAAQKEGFHDLIETYAKKYDEHFDADGNLVKQLLASSFWQPLYYSRTEMKNPEFTQMVDNVIYFEGNPYAIHSFSLPEDSEATAEAAKQINPDLTVDEMTVYTNPAFYRYIAGIDHQ